MILSNIEHTKTIDDILVDNTSEDESDYEYEFPLYQCEKGQHIFFKYTLISITPLLLFPVMLFVVSSYKVLRMFWY